MWSRCLDENGHRSRALPIIKDATVIGVSRLPFSSYGAKTRSPLSLLTKLLKGNTVTLGVSLPLKNWRFSFDVHFDSSYVKDEASLELTNRIELALVNKGYEALTDDRNQREMELNSAIAI